MTPIDRTLRFVLLADSLPLPAWQAVALDELLESGLAECALIVVRAAMPKAAPGSRISDLVRRRRHLLWRLFDRFYVRRCCKATRSAELPEGLASAPVAECAPDKVGRFGEAFPAAILDRIADARPDFIIRFGFGILKGAILHAAPYGLWSFHHGDPGRYRGQPPGFWEMFDRQTVAGSILQSLNEKLDAGTVMFAGHFAVRRHSYAKTRDALYFGTAGWLRQCCALLRDGQWPPRLHQPVPVDGPVRTLPTNGEMLAFLARAAWAWCKLQWRYRLCVQQWAIGVVHSPIDAVAGISPAAPALADARWMPERPGQFAADPFGMPAGSGAGGLRAYYELFDWAAGLGRIASVDIDEHGDFGEPVDRLALPSHLSYPFLIEDGSRWHCLPENSAAGGLSSFTVATDGSLAPSAKLLADEPLIDSTIVRWQDRYWCFALIDRHAHNAELSLFHADALDGHWTPHPQNPVKTDVRSARPGGTPFVVDGKLYRPAQDCAAHYGSALSLCEVEVMNEREFRERVVGRLTPPRGSPCPDGMHTLSAVGDATLIDGARLKFAPLLARRARG